jgi:hypothetical protein
MVALVLAAVLGTAGAGKLSARAPGEDTALARKLGEGRATGLLRGVGALELALAAAVLFRPVAGIGVAALGVGFLGYLTWARVTAPGSSCGCSSRRHAPITWRAFARAALVAGGGVAAAAADRPWWSAVADHPARAVVVLVLVAAAFAALSTDLDHRWLLPLRRARIRLLGHPLAGTGGTVPLAATVELLERSLAWESAAPVVRSGLVEHWDADGWRVLRYAGVSEEGRAVSVLFALDAQASSATTADPVVRLTVLEEDALAPA